MSHNHFKYSYKQTNKPLVIPVNISSNSSILTAFYAIYCCYSICFPKCKTNIVQTNKQKKLLFFLVDSYSDILKIISTPNFPAYSTISYIILYYKLFLTIKLYILQFTIAYSLCTTSSL